MPELTNLIHVGYQLKLISIPCKRTSDANACPNLAPAQDNTTYDDHLGAQPGLFNSHLHLLFLSLYQFAYPEIDGIFPILFYRTITHARLC